ncbi:MAG: ribosome silencing factor [Ignavibacteriaceae bacterium]|nr:ribosome silencing factor [Ignavibacteriaceae bacterium]
MSNKIIDRIVELIFTKKGYDVKILDLRSLTAIADYFIICSADSDTQVKAIADEVDKKMREEGVRSWHTEGYRSLNWVLIDFVDIVVHVFKKESRDYYSLDKLWGDAPVVVAEDPLLKLPVKKKPGRPKKIKSDL